MPEFICMKKCFHNKRLWKPGQIATFARENLAPQHFKLLEDHEAEQKIDREIEAQGTVSADFDELEKKFKELKKENANLKRKNTLLEKKVAAE